MTIMQKNQQISTNTPICKMNKFRPVRFVNDKKTASVPSIWIAKENNGFKCFWPIYGLNKKLQNCVPPPLEVDVEERRKWKILECVLLDEEGTFKKDRQQNSFK